jgi:hypothetical protein
MTGPGGTGAGGGCAGGVVCAEGEGGGTCCEGGWSGAVCCASSTAVPEERKKAINKKEICTAERIAEMLQWRPGPVSGGSPANREAKLGVSIRADFSFRRLRACYR